MIRKLMHLSRALAAVAALSAFSASAAPAATTFHSAVSSVAIAGTQTFDHVFTTSAGTATCESVTFSGSVSAKTSSTQTLVPHYADCDAFGFINVPIDVNGCAYIFNANGTTNIECPAGKQIAITTPWCTTTIGAQHLPNGQVYTNSGTTPNRKLIAHSNISGIKYNECGTDRANGTYRGTSQISTISGENWVS